jgi:hypothetical protein
MKRFGIVVALVVVAIAVYMVAANYRSVLPSAPIVQSDEPDYSSEHLELSFDHPNFYDIQSQHAGNEEREWHVLVFVPKNYIPPQGGEGPATITISVFDNPERTPLETWIRGDARSNFKLSEDGALTPVVVGGESGLSYRHSGLYEADAVAVQHDQRIYVFAAQWQTPEDETREQLKDLLKTVKFL